MSPAFSGGPLDGMLGYAQGIDPPADQLAGGAAAPAGPPPGGDPQGEEELSPQERFDRLINDARSLASSDGEFSEQDKLIIEKVTTLIQQLRAGREKDEQQAMMGKLTPGSSVMRKAYG